MIGDSQNDLPMLTHVPNSIAMGNSEPEVMKACSYVTSPVDQDGIAAMEGDQNHTRDREPSPVSQLGTTKPIPINLLYTNGLMGIRCIGNRNFR